MQKIHGRWDLEEKPFFPDAVGPEGTLIEVCVAICGAVGTEVLETRETLRAGAAGGVDPAPADVVVDFEGCDVLADFLLG